MADHRENMVAGDLARLRHRIFNPSTEGSNPSKPVIPNNKIVMSHKNRKKRKPERLRLANDLQPYKLARCYRELVVKPKHDNDDKKLGG